MKTKAILVVVIAIAVVLLVVRLIQPAPQTKLQNPPPHVIVKAPSPTLGSSAEADKQTTARTQQPLQENVPGEQESWALEPLPPGRNQQERLEEFARRRGVPVNVLTQQIMEVWSNAWSEHLNGTIEFYGEALDETGAPLKGATAKIRCLIFPEKLFLTNVPTDANGLFVLEGLTGQALTAAVTKEGYEEVPGTNENHFDYYGVANCLRPNRDKPVVFRLRKKSPVQ